MNMGKQVLSLPCLPPHKKDHTMSPELTYLVCVLILALIQIVLTATLRTRETGLPYNVGPRDKPSSAAIGKITGRMMRAQANLFETLPIFIGALLATQVMHQHSHMTCWGAGLYFWSRVFYIPLYGFGIPHGRSIVWFISIVGILMLLKSLTGV